MPKSGAQGRCVSAFLAYSSVLGYLDFPRGSAIYSGFDIELPGGIGVVHV